MKKLFLLLSLMVFFYACERSLENEFPQEQDPMLSIKEQVLNQDKPTSIDNIVTYVQHLANENSQNITFDLLISPEGYKGINFELTTEADKAVVWTHALENEGLFESDNTNIYQKEKMYYVYCAHNDDSVTRTECGTTRCAADAVQSCLKSGGCATVCQGSILYMEEEQAFVVELID